MARRKPFPQMWALSGAGCVDVSCPVPGSVAEAVSLAGIQNPDAEPEPEAKPNPASRVDETRYTWITQHSWALTAELLLDECVAERHYIEIEGLFGYGALHVNTTPVAHFNCTAGETLRADITSHVVPGQEKLTVTVHFAAEPFETRLGAILPGIRGGVWLHGVNRLLIAQFGVRPDHVQTSLITVGRVLPYASGTYTFCYALSHGEQPLGLRLFEQELGEEETEFAHELNVADAVDWTPGSPNALYHVKLTVLWGHLGCDLAHQRVGFMRVNSQRAWPKFPPCLWAVNRKPVQLRGVAWVAPIWHPSKPDWVRGQIAALLESGIQCLYVAAPQEEIFYDLCDHLGMLVWQGLPIDGAMVKATARRLMHRPCVAQWALPAEVLEGADPEQAEANMGEVLAALGDDRPFVGITPGGPIPYPEWKELGQRQCYNVAGPLGYLGPEFMPRYANDDDALLRSTGLAALSAPEKLYGLPWPRGGPLWETQGGPLTCLELPEAPLWFGRGVADSLDRTALLSRYLQAEGLRYLAQRTRGRGVAGFFAGSAGQVNEGYASDAILERDLESVGARRPAYYALRDAYAPLHPCLIVDRTANWVRTWLDVGVQLLVSPEATRPASKRTVTATLYDQAGFSLAEEIWEVPCQTGMLGRMAAQLPDDPGAVLLRLEVYNGGQSEARTDTVFCVGLRSLQEALTHAPQTTLWLDGEALANTGSHLALGVSCGHFARPELPAWGAMLPGERLPVGLGAAVECLNAKITVTEGVRHE
ncbi:MAG: hypothetical protein FWD25_02395 [Clostridia bacterium]|nr:hypothetical protein [Clostridia bacterium]